jgi:primase-polymerase (primpol)-like protein
VKNELIEALKPYPQWVLWMLRDGKKIPFQVSTGHFADVSNPKTWTTYNKVEDSKKKGFVLTEKDPFTVIDLDHCIGAQGQVKSEITKILLYFQSYTEISPSGTGFHIWVRGKIPNAIKRTEFEIYSDLRYMTVTGNPSFNCPLASCQLQLDKVYEKYGQPSFAEKEVFDVLDCQADLQQLYKVSPQLRRIWSLDCGFWKADGNPDCSSYDMALAGLLRDWSGEQITWAIKFFRAQHGFASKHEGAIALTVAKALEDKS